MFPCVSHYITVVSRGFAMTSSYIEEAVENHTRIELCRVEPAPRSGKGPYDQHLFHRLRFASF